MVVFVRGRRRSVLRERGPKRPVVLNRGLGAAGRQQLAHQLSAANRLHVLAKPVDGDVAVALCNRSSSTAATASRLQATGGRSRSAAPTYGRGLGVHARSEVRYHLGGRLLTGSGVVRGTDGPVRSRPT